MKRPVLIALLLIAAVDPAQAAPTAQVIQYRTAKAADGYMSTSAEGSFQVIFLRPDGSSPAGYATGSGMLATPAQPGFFDASKPWVIFKHTKPDGSLGCFSSMNLTPQAPSEVIEVGRYQLIDQTTTTHQAVVLLSVPCARGSDSEAVALWYVPRYADPPGQFAWTLPFSGGASDPRGSATLHGINYDAYFTVCGDVSGCLKPVAQSYWRIYDANLTISK
ncbi:MAG: hypothetical protein ACLGH3_06900 [Actinomycetota bacterium]